MLARLLTSFYLQALRSPACGRVVRTVIVLMSREASPRGRTAHAGAGTTVPFR